MNMSNLPSSLPPHYRANGPNMSLLQLITDVCDATGNEFYIYMEDATTAQIGLVDLNPAQGQATTDFEWIQNYGVNNPNVRVTDRSYGREIRIEKQKNAIFGEKIHYLTLATDLVPFFGEDNQCAPVYAKPGGTCGFKVMVNTAPLAASMRNPGVFANAGNKAIDEFDLRSNFDLWKERVLVAPNNKLSPFDVIAKQWLTANDIKKDPLTAAEATARGIDPTAYNNNRFDINANNPQGADGKLAEERYNEDIKKIFGYIESLQQTYYGKQYLAKIVEPICARRSGDIISEASSSTGGCASSEVVYSSQPTNDGGWVEGGSVMGIGDPYLGFFKQEDGRVGSFALFTVAGDTPPNTGTGTGDGTNYSPGGGNGESENP
jgi:hypothetical protein